jgi:hypothetical protein
MNWIKQIFSPCPAEREVIPSAAVVLPFPLPVKTINNPFFIVSILQRPLLAFSSIGLGSNTH